MKLTEKQAIQMLGRQVSSMRKELITINERLKKGGKDTDACFDSIRRLTLILKQERQAIKVIEDNLDANEKSINQLVEIRKMFGHFIWFIRGAVVIAASVWVFGGWIKDNLAALGALFGS